MTANVLSLACVSFWRTLSTKWRGHPTYDLWNLIAQAIIYRPPGLIQVSTVKSHVQLDSIQDPWAKLISQTNGEADTLAKTAVSTHLTQRLPMTSQWNPSLEKRSLELATLATRFLHEMSELLFKIRKENTEDQHEDPLPLAEVDDTIHFQLHPFQMPDLFPEFKWDQRWLKLVMHYFLFEVVRCQPCGHWNFLYRSFARLHDRLPNPSSA